MDNLQAQHAFDQIEMHLEVVKNDVLSRIGDPNQISDLEEKIEELESDLWDKKNEIEKLEDAIREAISELESSELSHIKDIIQNLRDAL